MTQGNFMSWTGACVKCGKIRQSGHGLFCSNFLLGRERSPPCRNVWCRPCYQEASNDTFLRLDDNEEGLNASDLEVEQSHPTLSRYRCGRNGDHLMGVPFKWDLCSFRNVCGREPAWGDRWDQFTLTLIRWVQLDVMWAREPHTVSTNWSRAKADYEVTMRYLSIRPETLLPQLGSETLRDRVGMAEALATLTTSLRPGRNSTNIQWDTVRKTQTWLNNAHDAGREYLCETVVGVDRAKQYVTTGHSAGKWFGCFMKGALLRMGMIRKQNEALTSDFTMAVSAAAEERWHTVGMVEEAKEALEDVICFMLAAFGAGLRGEEVPLLLLEGLLTFWDETQIHADGAHIMLTLVGRFKGEVNDRWHLVPFSDNTRSGLPFRL